MDMNVLNNKMYEKTNVEKIQWFRHLKTKFYWEGSIKYINKLGKNKPTIKDNIFLQTNS